MNARIFALLVTALAALLTASCRRVPPPPPPESVIVGNVIDNFGRPVQGAIITIRDSAFRATTNVRGEFSITFPPGSFQVRIEAPQCVPFARELQVTQAVRYPLGTKMLFRIPEGARETAVVAAEEGYRPLPSVEFERRVVNFGSVYSAFPNRCAVFSMQRPVATLRGTGLIAVFPDANYRLVQVDDGHVTTDSFPRSVGQCPGVPQGAHGTEARSMPVPDHAFFFTEVLPTATYCFIRSTRFDPDDQANGRGYCFRWEPDPQVRWGSRLTEPPEEGPTGQREGDDHSPNAGGPPVNCPERDGKIPCTEECYRANAMWSDPDDPPVWFGQQAADGHCYMP